MSCGRKLVGQCDVMAERAARQPRHIVIMHGLNYKTERNVRESVSLGFVNVCLPNENI